jgi:hypothetical protein
MTDMNPNEESADFSQNQPLFNSMPAGQLKAIKAVIQDRTEST